MSVSKPKVVVFLECCYAGALYQSPDDSLGISRAVDHPCKKRVVEGFGTVVFMSCKGNETSAACVFASSLVEILEEHKNNVIAKLLVDEVSKRVLSKTRDSTCWSIQDPTYFSKDIDAIGSIGGLGGRDEEEPMEIDKIPIQRETSYPDSWSEICFKEKSEKVKSSLEGLKTKLSEKLRKPVDEVITMYENVHSLETRIVFCGESGCGKSTLINAIVGYAILPCSGGHSVCTSTVIEIKENKHNKFQAKVNFLERSDWIAEAKWLKKTLTNEKCDAGDQAEELLKKVYGSSDVDVEDLPENVEQIFKKPIIELEEQNERDLSKNLSCYVSSGMGQEKEYWPIVKSVEVFIPNCDILKGGVVLIDIPVFVDSNPVRKDIAEKEYKSAMNAFVCTKTTRSGANEIFQKLVQDYNEHLRGNKEVTFVLTRSDDDMKDVESYFESLGVNAQDYEYLKNLHDNNDEHFDIECAKHRNSQSRADVARNMKKEHIEDGSFERPVHSVSGLDYMFKKNIRKGMPFFRTLDETGVPHLINSVKRTAGNHAVSKYKRFLLECEKLPAKLENLSSTSDITPNFMRGHFPNLLNLEKNAEKTMQLCDGQYQKMKQNLEGALKNDFQSEPVNGGKKRYLQKGTFRAAVVRNGKWSPPKTMPVDLNASFLHNTVAFIKGDCAELVTNIKQHISDFFVKVLNASVESECKKHPEWKQGLLWFERNGELISRLLCEDLDDFPGKLESEMLRNMSTMLESLYLKIEHQNEFGNDAQSKFFWDVLNNIELKDKLKSSIEKLVEKEKCHCRKMLDGIVVDTFKDLWWTVSVSDEVKRSARGRSILDFKKSLDDILELKEERGHEEP